MTAQTIKNWNKENRYAFQTAEGFEMEKENRGTMKEAINHSADRIMDKMSEKPSGLAYIITMITVPAAMLLLLAASVTAVVAPIAWLGGWL